MIVIALSENLYCYNFNSLVKLDSLVAKNDNNFLSSLKKNAWFEEAPQRQKHFTSVN